MTSDPTGHPMTSDPTGHPMTDRTATYLRTIGGQPTFREQALYRMDPPLDGQTYVVVSALNLGLIRDTLIFPAVEDGRLDGDLSYLNAYALHDIADQTEALRRAGYTVTGGPDDDPDGDKP